jgi:hypothetical protein
MRFLQLLCLAGAVACTLSADTIYSNMSEPSADADGIAFLGPLYNSFTSGAAGQLSDLQLILSADGDGSVSGSVQVDLFADNSTAPGELIAVIGTVKDDTLSSIPATYDVALSSYPALADNTRYWIGLSGTTAAEWYYDFDASGIGVADEFFANQMGVFSNDNDPYQMSVMAAASTAPEPSTSLLIAIGISLMALAQLRRRA